MSQLNLTVRPHGNTSGSTTPTASVNDIPGFCQADVDAILAQMPNDDDTVIIPGVNNGRPMTKTEVTALVTTHSESAAAAGPEPVVDESTLPHATAESYWGVGLTGMAQFGFGDYGHNGYALQLFGERAWRLSDHWHIVPQATVDLAHGNRDFRHPGGGDVNSAYTVGGGGANLLFQATMPGWDWMTLRFGPGLSLSALSTPENSYENIPRIEGECPPDIPDVDCYAGQGANPGRANRGSTGLEDTRVGSSRDAEGGMAFDFRFPITVSGEIPIGANALVLGLLLQPGYRWLNPNVGTGGGHGTFGVGGQAAVHF